MVFSLALAGLACGTTHAHAQMIMDITTNSFVAGSATNSLDVTLTNTGSSSVTIAGFSFEITAASADVTFSDVTTSTVSAPYIFGANSGLGPDISPSGPGNYGQTISGADVYSTPNTGVTFTAGETLGLGNVIFALSPSTPNTPIGITFTPYPTSSLSDASANNITVGFAANPQMGPTSAPELPPAALVVTGLLAGVGVKFRRHGLAGLWARMASCRVSH